MSLQEKRNKKYRDLADYDKVEDLFLTLENLDWQLIRNLIAQQQQKDYIDWLRYYYKHESKQNYGHRFFEIDKWPSHGPAPRAYHNRFIYLLHYREPIIARGSKPLWKEMKAAKLALPIAVPTDLHKQKLAEKEVLGREQNYFVRQPLAPDRRAQVAEHLKNLGQLLSRDSQLGILVEYRMPHLDKLSWQQAGWMLGRVAYFLDLWQQFHEYERESIATDVKTFANDSNQKQLTLRQIALLHAYQPGEVITISGASIIAARHGHKSGAKLYDHYRRLSRASDRTAVADKAIGPMIADITVILPLLGENARRQAENELRVLEANR